MGPPPPVISFGIRPSPWGLGVLYLGAFRWPPGTRPTTMRPVGGNYILVYKPHHNKSPIAILAQASNRGDKLKTRIAQAGYEPAGTGEQFRHSTHRGARRDLDLAQTCGVGCRAHCLRWTLLGNSQSLHLNKTARSSSCATPAAVRRICSS
jgi:hypothetical protein